MRNMLNALVVAVASALVACGGTVPSLPDAQADRPDAQTPSLDAVAQGDALDARVIFCTDGISDDRCCAGSGPAFEDAGTPCITRTCPSGQEAELCHGSDAGVGSDADTADAQARPDALVCPDPNPIASCGPPPCTIYCSAFPCCCPDGTAGTSCFPEN